MSESRTVTATFGLYASQADALRLAFQANVLGTIRWTSDEREPVELELTIAGSSRPIYVSRPSERVYAYTGPCEEPGCDGHHLVGHLPREWDHEPDAWEPMLFEVRVNGTSVARADLEKVLSVCAPADRVQQVRDLVTKIDGRTGFFR